VRGSVSYVEAGSDPGRVSDVAHCAQNFGQNAKLTISLSNTRRGRMAIAEDGRMATNMKPAGIGGRGIEPSRHRQDMSLSLWRALSPASFRGREIRPRHDTVADSRVLRLGRWGNQNKPVHLAITHPVSSPSRRLLRSPRGGGSRLVVAHVSPPRGYTRPGITAHPGATTGSLAMAFQDEVERCAHSVRWPSVNTQCASAKAQSETSATQDSQ